MNENEDFYIILPSNSNALTHPNNHASKYIVSWENPIILHGDMQKWRVALTELVYSHCPISAEQSCGISLDIKQRTYKAFPFTLNIDFQDKENVKIWALKDSFSSNTPKDIPVDILKRGIANFPDMEESNKTPTPKNFPKLSIYHGRVRFESKTYFEIHFKTHRNAQCCGFNNLIYKAPYKKGNRKYVLLARNKPSPRDSASINELIDGSVKIYSHSVLVKKNFFLDKEYTWKNNDEMMQTINKCLKNKFISFKLTENDIVQIEVSQDVYKFEFLSGLHYILGFHLKEMKNMTAGMTINAVHAPNLNRGYTNMYIYSSVCDPIQVGDLKAPLLKSFWIDKKNGGNVSHDEIRHIDVRNPMYVPVSTSSINTIEINIRSDSGILIPFTSSAITSITLHFKRNK